MSLGDAIRGLIDPLDPRVAAWLRRELPKLVADGMLDPVQAESIARRYGVRLDGTPTAAPAMGVPPSDRAADRPATPEATAGSPPTPALGLTAATTTAGTGPAEERPAGTGPTTPATSPFFAEHAVSIVLYLGAFLVVSAVVIFLTYSWEDIDGGTKVAILALLTLGFLGAAALCLPRQSVRPAGRTFLAIGAILVPANVAAVYLVYFQDGPLPAALFWLLGALTSGGLHALLSLRLGSRAYGALAVLAVPVAAGALAWLVEPEEAWIGPAMAVALAIMLAAARPWPSIPMVQAARGLGSVLLALTALVSLPWLSERGAESAAPAIALVLASAGLAWEATRRGGTWWVGAAAGLVLAPFVALALTIADARPLFVGAIVVAGWSAALVARRLAARQSLLWDAAALASASIYPFAAWTDDAESMVLFASLALLALGLAWVRRSPLPLYAAVLAIDGAYVKLLAIYGSPDSPAWALGVALWPLGIAWAVAGTLLPRRVAGACWAGALLTLVGATLLTWEQARWNGGIAASAAVATAVASWRYGFGPGLLIAVPWLLLAGYQAGAVADLALPWRFVAAGATGWLLFAVSLIQPGEPAARASSTLTPTRAGSSVAPAAARLVSSAEGSAASPTEGSMTGSPGADTSAGSAANAPRPSAGRLGYAPELAWSTSARLAAAATAGLGALLVSALLDGRDRPWLASSVAWADLALLIAAWAWAARSHNLAVVAALAGAPALLSEIARFNPDDGQAYAIPLGLYLLAVAWLDRRARRDAHPWPPSAIAAVALLVLLGTGVIQSLDANRFMHALWTFAESLALLGAGIAVRWRVLVVGGVAGTVLVALRQLFDAVSALPGWAILGGSGLLLLGIAVALLLARARLAAAGRAAAERWSSWD